MNSVRWLGILHSYWYCTKYPIISMNQRSCSIHGNFGFSLDFLFPYIFKWILYQCINLRPRLLWTKKRLCFVKKKGKIILISMNLFSPTISDMSVEKACYLLRNLRCRSRSSYDIKWHHKSDKGNFSLHETKDSYK